MLLSSGSTLPQLGARGFSLISLNVLIPNSVDGWWIYKMYDGRTAHATTEWPARQRLLKHLLLTANADVVMLQETAAESFLDDFAFMRAEGYECALLSKGRMRPATFWKASRFARCSPTGLLEPPGAAAAGDVAPVLPTELGGVYSKDRVLLTTLRLIEEGAPVERAPPVYFVNVHLAAGPEAPRRLRQVHEALEAVRKLHAKAATPSPPACVVAGDFNSQGRSAVCELLFSGEVLPTFRESGDPTEPRQSENQVTSKPKRQAVGTFVDAYVAADLDASTRPAGARQPTLVAANLQPKMQRDDGEASDALCAKLAEAFSTLSADGATLTVAEQKEWLLKVNRQLGRGSEYRTAERLRAARGGDLTLQDFIEVYCDELRMGKFWGVEHDLRVLSTGPAAPGLTRDDAWRDLARAMEGEGDEGSRATDACLTQ